MKYYRVPKIVQRIFPKLLFAFPQKSKAVFLTFDDGPHQIFTPHILDILDEHHAKATFFLLGEKLKPNREIILRMKNANHTIGIHGFNHISLLIKSRTEIRQQIESAKSELESILGEPVRFFRPPFGKFNRAVLKTCQQLSLRPVLWSLMTYDFYDQLSNSDLLNTFQKRLRGGDIVVLHDGNDNSERMARVLPEMIGIVWERGMKLSEITLADG